jgi:hypothetical protein
MLGPHNHNKSNITEVNQDICQLNDSSNSTCVSDVSKVICGHNYSHLTITGRDDVKVYSMDRTELRILYQSQKDCRRSYMVCLYLSGEHYEQTIKVNEKCKIVRTQRYSRCFRGFDEAIHNVLYLERINHLLYSW